MLKLSKQDSPLTTDQTVAQAFVALMQQHLDYIEQWEASSRSWDDIEGVHQMRVGLRRMRSAMRLFRPAIPAELGRPWADEMRELAQMLGPARDLDVFISEGLTAMSGELPLPGETALQERAEQLRAEAYVTVREMLDGERYANFKRDFRQWLETEGWQQGPLSKKNQKNLSRKVRKFARKRLAKQHQKVMAQGVGADSHSAEQLHELRIECKKLRYAAEFYTPLFSGVDDFIDHLKSLQDLLGVINDAAVTQSLLNQLLEGTDNGEMQRYADGVMGWRSCERYQLQQQFNAGWDDFQATRTPW